MGRWDQYGHPHTLASAWGWGSMRTETAGVGPTGQHCHLSVCTVLGRCPVPFPNTKFQHVSETFIWQHGMAVRGAEGWRQPHAHHRLLDLGILAEKPKSSKWEEPALKDTIDRVNHWGYTPWLSMSLGSD
jgi:hypothetical protein